MKIYQILFDCINMLQWIILTRSATEVTFRIAEWQILQDFSCIFGNPGLNKTENDDHISSYRYFFSIPSINFCRICIIFTNFHIA
jgi:hypothetical protein